MNFLFWKALCCIYLVYLQSRLKQTEINFKEGMITKERYFDCKNVTNLVQCCTKDPQSDRTLHCCWSDPI